MTLYVVTSTKNGKTRELARVNAHSGGLAMQGKGEIVSGNAKRLGFNVRRNQSVYKTPKGRIIRAKRVDSPKRVV